MTFCQGSGRNMIDILSGGFRIRYIVRRTFCQDCVDLPQTNCQDLYVD